MHIYDIIFRNGKNYTFLLPREKWSRRTLHEKKTNKLRIRIGCLAFVLKKIFHLFIFDPAFYIVVQKITCSYGEIFALAQQCADAGQQQQ